MKVEKRLPFLTLFCTVFGPVVSVLVCYLQSVQQSVVERVCLFINMASFRSVFAAAGDHTIACTMLRYESGDQCELHGPPCFK